MSVLYTIESSAGTPSLAEAAAKLNVSESAMDVSFGVVPIDPAHNLYAVSVTTHDASTPASSDANLKGPFANPTIMPFGRVQNGD